MEADDFFSGYEALEGASRTIQLSLCDPCPINKIVWSSFDHITGPELRFVWEVVAAANLTPVALSTNSESTKDGSISTTSSMSKDTNSAVYEDIDDVLQIPENERPQYLDEFMMESRSTLAGTTNATDDDEDLARLMTSFASSSQFTEDEFQNESSSRTDDTYDIEVLTKWKNKATPSALSSPARLQSRKSDSSTNLDSGVEPVAVAYGLDPLTADSTSKCLKKLSFTSDSEEGDMDDSKNATSTADSDATVLNEQGLEASGLGDETMQSNACCSVTEENSRMQGEMDPEEVPQALTTSAVDSGIAGTISAHSDLSVYCLSPFVENGCYANPYGVNSSLLTQDLSVFCSKGDEGYSDIDKLNIDSPFAFNESADYDTLMEMSGESTLIQPTDDEFIAKLVLTDQVYSLQLPSTSLLHKVNIVPKRRLLIGSYLFPVKRAEDGKNVTCAISIITADSKYEWYMKRQDVIEEMFIDITPRLKASYYSEAVEDVICRMKTEFERMLIVLGAAERYSLCSSVEEIKVHHTHLFESKLQENSFLAKAITALLRSQAHCVIVGDERKSVLKVLHTLSLFVPQQWRWCSLRGLRHAFSPYLRLQAINRNELPLVITAGVESHWPIAVIDVDKRLVCVSSNYLKHRRRKQFRQKNDVAGILLSAGMDVEINNTRQNILELKNCHASSAVVDFLGKMDFLPYERHVRLGFVRQFMLSLENRARAFITYVKDASKPNATDKSSAVSSKWNLNAARKALDLTSESLFCIILAEAERLKTGFADFVCDTRSN